MRVVLADDHGVVRDGIRWMLVNEPSIEVVGEAADGRALLQLVEDLDPDVVVLDIRMPGMSGLETLDEIRKKDADLPVLMLTMHDEPELAASAIERGAHGYVLKSARRDELIHAIQTVAKGGVYLNAEIMTTLLHRVTSGKGRDLPALTAEQQEILQLVANGRGNREIAAELHLSEPLVKATLRQVFQALGARGRAEAVAIAMRLGIID